MLNRIQSAIRARPLDFAFLVALYIGFFVAGLGLLVAVLTFIACIVQGVRKKDWKQMIPALGFTVYFFLNVLLGLGLIPFAMAFTYLVLMAYGNYIIWRLLEE